jgi:hypothetical protein
MKNLRIFFAILSSVIITLAIMPRSAEACRDEQKHPASAKDGSGQEQQRAEGIPPGSPICTDGKTNPPQKKWWKDTAHILQTATLLFVGAYTVITYCLLQTSQDTERRQLRAYVGASTGDSPTISSMYPPALPSLTVYIKNTGQTPAYQVTHLSGAAVGPYPLPKTFDFSNTMQPDDLPEPITVFPGRLEGIAIEITSNRALSDDEINGLATGKNKRLYFWGTVTYQDAFSASRYTNFCFGYYAITTTGIRHDACERHNDSN